MHLSFQIHLSSLDTFVAHWSAAYAEKPDEADERYLENIGKPLTHQSLTELFKWKNGTEISKRKMESITKNYPLSFTGDQKDRYLNPKMQGGAIWNIFYLHCLDSDRWPIFDQHTFRAMNYLRHETNLDIPPSNKQKYNVYENEYIPFYNSISTEPHRNKDRALFAFGQFLKIAKRYA